MQVILNTAVTKCSPTNKETIEKLKTHDAKMMKIKKFLWLLLQLMAQKHKTDVIVHQNNTLNQYKWFLNRVEIYNKICDLITVTDTTWLL